MPQKNKRPKKIAVLGGGMASLTSVTRLTESPGWQDHYDITVYQMGWRLGGKGASGRNPEISDRIEEHGLHLWFGCYHNAFNLIRKCYEELGRPPEKPLSTWKEAFMPADFVALSEYTKSGYTLWPMDFPNTGETPGTADSIPTVWENVTKMLRIMVERYLDAILVHTFRPSPEVTEEEKQMYRQLNTELLEEVQSYAANFGVEFDSTDLYQLVEFMENFLDEQHRNGNYDLLLFALDEARTWIWERIEDKIDQYHELRQLWILFDLTAATIKGVVKDELIWKGLDVINHLDFREWIGQYCFTPKMTAWSAPVQVMYGLIFCGKDHHTFEAGTCLRSIFRVALDYKGAFYYRMTAGMGDVVFTPMYEVLKKRGVKFKFFHKVTNISLSPDHTKVSRIDIGIQATSKNGEYNPLCEVKELPCWPNRPLYEQLAEGEELRSGKIDLESSWSDWDFVDRITLEDGKDFDEVLLGISIAALPWVCGELIDHDPRWRDMMDHVATTPTQALQLWLKPGLPGLGWKFLHQSMPMTGNFAGELDTWCDLSHLISRENWPENAWPAHNAYWCGRLDDYPVESFDDKNLPQDALKKVRENVLKLLNEHAQNLWPASKDPQTGTFNWNLLADPEARKGESRLNAQYFRANVEPTDRYVLSVKNSSKYRLKSDASGFKNLFLTGDWIDNGFNAGCIEATVISGLQAARAISGGNEEITGEKDTVDAIRSKKLKIK